MQINRKKMNRLLSNTLSRGLKALFAFLVLSMLVYNAEPVDVSACIPLNTPDTIYSLTTNVSAAGTCFNITADNVTLDCQGYTINYSTSTWGYAINNTEGYNHTTIQNCNIVQGSTESASFGINFSSTSNSTITNNNITTHGGGSYGIVLSAGADNNITNNNISTNSSYANGIKVMINIYANSSNYLIQSNTIQTSDANGIEIACITNSTFANNSITTNGSDKYGIYLSMSSYNNIISNSTIQSRQSYAVYAFNNDNPNTIYNCLLNGSNNAIRLLSYANNSWNISNQSGTRIYSNGTRIGGNYYTNSTGTGYSDTCADADRDGFCDSPYNITTNSSCIAGSTCGNNTDYLPYSSGYLANTLNVSLNTPINATNTTDTNISFNYTVIGSNSTYNCTLYLNDVSNNTNTNTSNNTASLINVSGLSNGTYVWKVICSINGTVYNESIQNYTLTITNVVNATLNVTLNSPQNSSVHNSTNISFNYTVIGSNTTYNATLYLNGSINATATNVQNNTLSTFNISYIGPGMYWWNITAHINSTTYNYSQTYNLTVVTTTTTTTTTTPPKISVCQVNATSVIQGQSINISSRVINNSAYNISSAWYQLNLSSNTTYTNKSGEYFSAIINTSNMYGNYSIKCWGNDTLNARNSTTNGSFVVVTTTTTTTTTLGVMLVRYKFAENRSDYIVNSAGPVNGSVIGSNLTWLSGGVKDGAARFEGKQIISAGLMNYTYTQITFFVCAANITSEGNLISYLLPSGYYLRIYGYTDGSVNFDAPYSGQGFKTNTNYKTGYHCYTLSCDGSKCYAYADKKYERSLTYSGNFSSVSGVYVGARNASGTINENVSAYIDEVRVYSKNLSHAEINSTVDELLPSADSTLISFVNPISNGSKINSTSVLINLSAQTPNMSSLKLYINNKDYFFHNNSLLLALNLNNNSAIGESERVVMDSSPYQRNGSFRGSGSWTGSGKFGGAASLSGGAIDFADDANLSFSGNSSQTIMFWVYLSSCNPGTAQYVFESDENYQIQIWDCRIYYIQRAADGTWHREWRSANTYPTAGQWQHISVVFDGDVSCSANSVNMFVDSSPVEVELTNCSGGNWTDAATTKFRLGSAYYSETPSYTLSGKLDEFRLYRGKLSTNEIRYTYNSDIHRINYSSWNAAINLTTLSDGTYNYYGYVNDSTGAYARTDSGDVRTFFINTSVTYAVPIISDVQVTYLSQSSAVIIWKTDLSSSSRVEYGLNESYGSNATTPGNAYNHTVILSSLNANTLYHYRVVSNASNMTANSTDHTFRTAYFYMVNNTNTTANQTTTITIPNTNLSLEVVTNNSASNISINVTSSTDSQLSAGLTAADLNKYLRIEASGELTNTLKSAMIKIYYADYEVWDAGLNESDLSIYWYNTGSYQWVKVTTELNWVYGTGVNTTANYVWANVSHFSYYAVGGIEDYSCTLEGDESPCGIVTISEVITLITRWANDEANLSDVIALISGWAASS